MAENIAHDDIRPGDGSSGQSMVAALQDAEALYLSLVEHIPLCVYRVDLEGRLTFGNSAYLADVGRPLESLLGKTVFDLFPEEQARKYDADDRWVIETGRVFRDVERHEVRGETKYVEVLKSLVRDHLGQPIGVQGLYWDVTARRRAEEQVQKTLAELERSNRDLQQFAAVASHDMHAPLRRIVLACRLLEEQCLNCQKIGGRELFDSIIASAEHMQQLIENLLAHSRIGALDKPLEPVDCGVAAGKALRNLEPAIRESQAVVEVSELPVVMASTVEMLQLFQNLVGNAIKYRGSQPPRIRLRAEAAERSWRFSIEDNGIGIPEKDRDKIFEAFLRLHGDQEYEGTGIGLATCKKIVERLDGRIWVESGEGAGSRFVFTIPDRPVPPTGDRP